MITAANTASASPSDVLATWADGYCVARGYGKPVAALNGRTRWFSVNKPGQAGRYILVGQGIEALAQICDPDVYVELAAPRASLVPNVPPGWQIRDPAYLMTGPSSWWDPTPPLPTGFSDQQSSFGRAIELVIQSPTGELAARGVAGLTGSTVVFDQIVTEPDFQRRGLGGFVMRTLAQAAATEGATNHVLIATEAGRELYHRLGWTVVSDVVSLIAPPHRSRAIEAAPCSTSSHASLAHRSSTGTAVPAGSDTTE